MATLQHLGGNPEGREELIKHSGPKSGWESNKHLAPLQAQIRVAVPHLKWRSFAHMKCGHLTGTKPSESAIQVATVN
jgi:hypothetical protein